MLDIWLSSIRVGWLLEHCILSTHAISYCMWKFILFPGILVILKVFFLSLISKFDNDPN